MVKLLNPSTDFYKRLALECSGQQIAVDLFVIARWVNKYSEATSGKIWPKTPYKVWKFQFKQWECTFQPTLWPGHSLWHLKVLRWTSQLTHSPHVIWPILLNNSIHIICSQTFYCWPRCKLSLDTTAITTPLKPRDLNERSEDILQERSSKPKPGNFPFALEDNYISSQIGFEAVMRIRCTRGMALHTFHGEYSKYRVGFPSESFHQNNFHDESMSLTLESLHQIVAGHFFVRSTDLLSLPNVNPDSAFGMQVHQHQHDRKTHPNSKILINFFKVSVKITYFF